MFAFIKRWKDNKRARRFADGRRFAEQEIAMFGDGAIDNLERNVECMAHFGDYDDFDMGVEAAIKDYNDSLNKN